MTKYGQPLKTILYLLGQKENVTAYEKKHGIFCSGMNLIFQQDDIHFYEVLKTDRSKTLTIVYRTGVNSDSWLMWRPTKLQARTLTGYFKVIYNDVEDFNKKHKRR